MIFRLLERGNSNGFFAFQPAFSVKKGIGNSGERGICSSI